MGWLVLGLLSTCTLRSLPAADEPEPPAEPASSWDKLLESEVVRAFTEGKFSLNLRLRWEYADQEGLKPSNAVTIRPRFGFTTAEVYGIQAMIEGENVTSLGAKYNPAGLDPDETDRTVIADPETTEINQVWGSYHRWDSLARVGRQRIVLDNHRFVGDVGWRQNMQTYDAVIARIDAIPKVSLFYGYLFEVNRVLGDDHPQGNYDSDSHVANVSFEACSWAKITGYGYFLDLESSPADSSNTVGGSLTGGGTIVDDLQLEYRAEIAWQTDASPNPNDYDTLYYNLEANLTWRPVIGGVGYEVLGGDRESGFRTPLATLHKFNGWADVFLTTPNDGLQDLWGKVGATLPGDLRLEAIYHKFWSERGGGDLGQEIDAALSRDFGKYLKALVKYAYYDGRGSDQPDIQRLWVQLEFIY